MPKENIETGVDSLLATEFSEIVQQLGVESGVIQEDAEEDIQYKFHIDSPESIKQRLSELHAVQVKGPVEQVDYYFLYPGQKPSFLTESICWREEREFVDYNRLGENRNIPTGQLIYKTNPHTEGSDHTRRIRRIFVDNEDAQLAVLTKLKEVRKGHDFAPYSVAKRRTTYLLPTQEGNGGQTVLIHIDENVQLGDRSEESDYLVHPVGNFLEITVSNPETDQLRVAKDLLGIEGEPFDVPYIAKDAFLHRLYRTSYHPSRIQVISAETDWLRTRHKPYYYDASTNTYMVGIDPAKLGYLDKQSQIEARHQTVEICQDLDASNGGYDLPSRPSGKGTGSSTYERLTGHDGFKHYPTIRSNIRSATLYRKRWQPGDRRVVFSRVEFSGDPPREGLFIHFLGNHEAYSAWLSRHQK